MQYCLGWFWTVLMKTDSKNSLGRLFCSLNLTLKRNIFHFINPDNFFAVWVISVLLCIWFDGEQLVTISGAITTWKPEKNQVNVGNIKNWNTHLMLKKKDPESSWNFFQFLLKEAIKSLETNLELHRLKVFYCNLCFLIFKFQI